MGPETSSSDVMGIIADIVSNREGGASHLNSGVIGSATGADEYVFSFGCLFGFLFLLPRLGWMF